MQREMRRGKKGAIELSIGTIVIVVLAMSMLILGIILVRNIFSGTTEAVTSINKGVVNEINSIFTKADARIAIAPTTNRITLKQGSKEGGFAFSVRNNAQTEQKFTWIAGVDAEFNIKQKCEALSIKEANSWLVIGQGSFSLPAGRSMEEPKLVIFTVPETATPCTVPYKVEVRSGTQLYDERTVYVTIEGK